MTLKYKLIGGLIVLAIVAVECGKNHQKASSPDYTKFVDPLIGTDADGHTFPGAVLPWGMVQLSPDTRINEKDDCAGYHYADSSILGFSHTHYSGTGEGAGGDIMLMPTVGEVQCDAGKANDTKSGYRSTFSHDEEVASPGYYKVFLEDDQITAELTVTRRIGLHRYTFPETNQANIILDLTHGIHDKADSLYLKIVNDRKIVGFRSSVGGLRMYQKLCFAAELSRPFQNSGIVVDGRPTRQTRAGGKVLDETDDDVNAAYALGNMFTCAKLNHSLLSFEKELKGYTKDSRKEVTIRAKMCLGKLYAYTE